MFSVWFAGFIVVLIIAALLGLLLMMVAFDEVEARRALAVGVVASPVVALLWPLVLLCATLVGLGYCLFTTARVIKHRSLSFDDVS